MQTYTTQSPKQKVLEQMDQFSLALSEFKALQPPELKPIVELMEAGVCELRHTLTQEWVGE